MRAYADTKHPLTLLGISTQDNKQLQGRSRALKVTFVPFIVGLAVQVCSHAPSLSRATLFCSTVLPSPGMFTPDWILPWVSILNMFYIYYTFTVTYGNWPTQGCRHPLFMLYLYIIHTRSPTAKHIHTHPSLSHVSASDISQSLMRHGPPHMCVVGRG